MRVDRDQLERWQRAAADNGERLSELVRRAVEAELARLRAPKCSG
jgi:hypothetical protein